MKNSFFIMASAALAGCATTTQTYDMAHAVNAQVNAQISYQTDLQQYGQSDRWVVEPASGKGDCEDYALTKAERLRQFGVVAKVQTCMMRSGVWHAVALVDDAGTEWVLDNTRPYPTPRSAFGCVSWMDQSTTKAIYHGK